MKDYHINIYYSDTLQGYVADIPDLEGCRVLAVSPQDALSNILITKQKWLDDATKNGALIPDPQSHEIEFTPQTIKMMLTDSEQFASMLLFEIRAPLTMIMGYSELLQQQELGAISEKQSHVAFLINKAAARLNILFHSIHDSEQLRAGRFQVNVQPFFFQDEVHNSLDTFRKNIVEKQQQLKLKISSDLPQAIADPFHLRNTLNHLFDNASHFSPEGSEIVLQADVDPAKNILHVQIMCRGSNISDPYFESAINNPYNSKYSYPSVLAIGLFIATKLVELNGGKMWIDAEVYVGSTFHFTLPIADE